MKLRPSRGIWAICALAVLLALLTAGALRARTLAFSALNGRQAARQDQDERVTRFDLIAQTQMSQTLPKIGGWLTVVQPEEVSIRAARGTLCATLYPALSGDADAPLVIALHGGAGTTRAQMQDVACELSLAGYRVLTPDLGAHGASDGLLASPGARDAQDVLAWVEWAQSRQPGAKIALMGQDEGALAALLAAAQGAPVCAVATDSATLAPKARAEAHAQSALDRLLLGAAHRLIFGAPLENVPADRLQTIDVPLLLLHGTGDDVSPAYVSEDIAAAVGENARVRFIEGAGHGMARYVEPQTYYAELIGFLSEALNF